MAPRRSLRSRLRRHCCFSTLQLAEKHMQRARQILASQKREDAEAALVPIEAVLELCPSLEKALELKAHTLLWLRRYKDVVEMLHEYVPSLIPATTNSPPHLTSTQASCSSLYPITTPESSALKERARLLAGFDPNRDDFLLSSPVGHCFSIAKLRHRLTVRLSQKTIGRQQQWRYLVLGQACFHLGMLEDAMVLLQRGKRAASAVSRLCSNGLREDNFSSDAELGGSHCNQTLLVASDTDMVAQMLENIKFLLRRRTAAMAALEAGLYAESVRHFSKIIDGRKGSPRAFIADCYLQRGIAYQATRRVVDAIADCNRSLALNPNCAKALSVRASLYEMVGCYSECLLDLQQLKMIYEASLRYQMFPEPRMWKMRQQQLAADIDLAGGLDCVNSKIAATRQRLSGVCSLDAHTILEMPKSCTMDDVKRVFLVLSLKHRPDTAIHFIDRCELVDDERDMETVREEVRASAHRLSQLIHKAYTMVLSCITEEEDSKKQGRLLKANKPKDRLDAVSPLIEMDDEKVGGSVEAVRGICTTVGESGLGKRVMHASLNDVSHEAQSGCSTSCSIYDESRGVEDEGDVCDFCQPFGGLTTAALANVLSQALLHDVPISTTAATATVGGPWTPDWSLALPLQVT